MTWNAKSVFVAVILAAICHRPSRAAVEEVLFDYSTAYGGGLITDHEAGHIIKIPEIAEITEFGVVMRSRFGNTVDDVILRLYTVTNFQSGIPDQLIWSGAFDNVALTGVPAFYSIDVPNVVVPRVFGFTLQTASGDELWLPNGFPDDPDHFGTWGGLLLQDDDGEWIVGTPFTPRAVKISGILTGVVPEPSHLALLAGISAFVAVNRRCQRFGR